jgi:BirA family biotin operon repressor/biotin-[acetyl-CoA-carboxylase] ligase
LPHPVTIPPYKPGLPVGHNFIELNSVDSTNNYAMANVHAGLAFPGTVFFAHDQFAGKGQRGKTWAARPGENIMMSIVLQPGFLPVRSQFALSACIAVACHDFFNKYALHKVYIKWPNDLYWGDRKAGGILIENIIGAPPADEIQDSQATNAYWNWAVAGIGININQVQFPDGLRNPVSLKQVTGKTYDTIALAKELCDCIEKRYTQLQQEDFSVLLNYYNTVLYKNNEPVTLKKEHLVFETTIKGVNAAGQLQTKDNKKRTFDFGEVEWVIS